MAFFTPSNRSLTRDDIRVVNLRRLAVPGLVLVLGLSLGSFAGGVWVGSDLRPRRASSWTSLLSPMKAASPLRVSARWSAG